MSDVALAVVVQPLTARQREVLDFLQSYVHEHGYGPTLKELMARFGIRSLSTAWKHLRRLEEKGFITKRRFRERGIELTTSGRHCATCTCGEAPQ